MKSTPSIARSRIRGAVRTASLTVSAMAGALVIAGLSAGAAVATETPLITVPGPDYTQLMPDPDGTPAAEAPIPAAPIELDLLSPAPVEPVSPPAGPDGLKPCEVNCAPDDEPDPPAWGPDGIKPCEVDCGPGNGEDGNGEDGNGEDGNGEDGNGEDGNGEDGNGEDGNGEDGNGEDGNGGDDGSNETIPVPTRIDTGEGAGDHLQQLWLTLGGVLAAIGLGTLGYRAVRSRE